MFQICSSAKSMESIYSKKEPPKTAIKHQETNYSDQHLLHVQNLKTFFILRFEKQGMNRLKSRQRLGTAQTLSAVLLLGQWLPVSHRWYDHWPFSLESCTPLSLRWTSLWLYRYNMIFAYICYDKIAVCQVIITYTQLCNHNCISWSSDHSPYH